MTLARDLVDHLIDSHDTSDETNHLLRQLTARMDMFFASGRAQALRGDGENSGLWQQYMSREGTPSANVRIATIDLESLFSDAVIFLKQADVDPRAADGSTGGKKGSAVPPVTAFHVDTVTAMVKYLQKLLTTEMKDHYAIAKKAADSSRAANRRAVISIDYYSDRATDTNVLHKDTTGITLFVALHYINPQPMLGPEYIHDKWPIQSAGVGGKLNFVPYAKSPTDSTTSDKRFHAPWTRWHESYYWPRKLLSALEDARGALDDDKALHHVNLGPYGLVTFVDELIYHATPFNKSRGEDLETLFREVKFSGNSYKILPAKLTRSVSTTLLQGAPLPGLTGGAKKRCFLRLWISVARKSWYTELGRYS